MFSNLQKCVRNGTRMRHGVTGVLKDCTDNLSKHSVPKVQNVIKWINTHWKVPRFVTVREKVRTCNSCYEVTDNMFHRRSMALNVTIN